MNLQILFMRKLSVLGADIRGDDLHLMTSICRHFREFFYPVFHSSQMRRIVSGDMDDFHIRMSLRGRKPAQSRDPFGIATAPIESGPRDDINALIYKYET